MAQTLDRQDRQQIRDLLNLAAAYDEGLAQIAAEGDSNRDSAGAAIKGLAARELSRLLSGMDVERINRDRLGIRVSALRAAGVDNMEKLCALTVDQINSVKGIGDEAAWLIYTVAGKIKQEAAAGLKVHLSAEDRSDQATALLRALYQTRRDDAAIREARRLYDEYHDALSAAWQAARPAGGGLRWLFLSGSKKKAAADAALYLYGLVTGEYGERSAALLKQYDGRRILDDAGLWEDFKRSSASYYAVLDRLDRELGAAVDNSYSGLPEELVREVELQPLYTEGLKATLRGYQDFGTRYILRQGKVLLGDEMGLGKTVQAIAAMVSLRAVGATHFLVVCPASVLVNWTREIRQFCDLGVTQIRGGDLSAVRRWTEQGGVAVTTYDSISRFALPQDFSFAMLIADEAHYVKNPETRRTQSLLILARKAQRTLFMTGTPLENKVDEMCFLVSCLRPDVASQIKEMKYISAAPQFREKLAPVYLRRTRDDVLAELPELVEKEQWVELGMEEWKNYLLSVTAENFMAMRRVSWDAARPERSAKARRLVELCREAEEDGRKCIVFSYFRDTLSAACELLGEKAYGPITGSVSPSRRQQIVDDFSAAPDGAALICQVQAGGTGLNIQAASVVIFCEPQIKPSIESQAVSRAYRMGQIRSVLVHRLLADNTVDERILEILREKQEQFELYADQSAAGSEYLRAEQSLSAAIIAREKARLDEITESAGQT